MKLSNHSLTQSISFLQGVITKGGPETIEYDALNEAFNTVSSGVKSGALTKEYFESLQTGFDDSCQADTLHGHSRNKPFGYAGDFLIIDKIYREQVTADDRFSKWDIFWNNHAACKAVRNRKEYFINTITGKLNAGRPLHLLNVASGPARDLSELYKLIDPAQLFTLCIEADATAIKYASQLNKPNEKQIQFINKNIFRFDTDEQFDIIWSAGLFDYFTDAVFVRLTRKFMQWAKPGTEIIIGNFSDDNPSQQFMELVGDWFLHHRSAEQLTDLAIQAGADKNKVWVGSEPEGVNLFLHITI